LFCIDRHAAKISRKYLPVRRQDEKKIAFYPNNLSPFRLTGYLSWQVFPNEKVRTTLAGIRTLLISQ
jgi:hypothetical protein